MKPLTDKSIAKLSIVKKNRKYNLIRNGAVICHSSSEKKLKGMYKYGINFPFINDFSE